MSCATEGAPSTFSPTAAAASIYASSDRGKTTSILASTWRMGFRSIASKMSSQDPSCCEDQGAGIAVLVTSVGAPEALVGCRRKLDTFRYKRVLHSRRTGLRVQTVPYSRSRLTGNHQQARNICLPMIRGKTKTSHECPHMFPPRALTTVQNKFGRRGPTTPRQN